MRLDKIGIESVWIAIFGVMRKAGECPTPHYIAVVAYDGGEAVQIGVPKLFHRRYPPYPTGRFSLLVTDDACCMAHIHFALDWPLPQRVIDLGVEFRNHLNGSAAPLGMGLIGALAWFGVPTAAFMTKETSPQAVRQRLDALVRLFFAMRPILDFPRAVLRGRTLIATARIEAAGIPADAPAIQALAEDWLDIRKRIITHVDRSFGVYHNGRFSPVAFAAWLQVRRIDWPRDSRGDFNLSDEVFRERSRAIPALRPLKDLRTTLTAFDPHAITIGRDDRNRFPQRPFASRTGRNQPSTKMSLLGTAAWVRHLIKPKPGRGLALVDWSQQEFGIAAALSGDHAMQRAYLSGDPYLALAKASGSLPGSAFPGDYADVRERVKA